MYEHKWQDEICLNKSERVLLINKYKTKILGENVSCHYCLTIAHKMMMHIIINGYWNLINYGDNGGIMWFLLGLKEVT